MGNLKKEDKMTLETGYCG